jgi:hypothetical protein
VSIHLNGLLCRSMTCKPCQAEREYPRAGDPVCTHDQHCMVPDHLHRVVPPQRQPRCLICGSELHRDLGCPRHGANAQVSALPEPTDAPPPVYKPMFAVTREDLDDSQNGFASMVQQELMDGWRERVDAHTDELIWGSQAALPPEQRVMAKPIGILAAVEGYPSPEEQKSIDKHIAEKDFEEAARALWEYQFRVLMKKHKDYGPHNIARAPGGALNGLQVRIWDKIARIINLIESGATPENESLRDSFGDLGNYAFIAMLVLDGHWPGAE